MLLHLCSVSGFPVISGNEFTGQRLPHPPSARPAGGWWVPASKRLELAGIFLLEIFSFPSLLLSIHHPCFLALHLGIYVNKNVKLEDIKVYGFDYDYTLAHYSQNLQTLIYDLTKEHLVSEVSSQDWDFFVIALLLAKQSSITESSSVISA